VLGLKIFYLKSMRFYIILIFGLLLVSCEEDSKLENEISNIDIDFVVERFDTAELDATPKDLPKLKKGFPFLFSKHTPDSIWVNRLNDTLQNEILNEVKKAFPDFKNTKNDINQMFQHLMYYNKVFSVPRVVTYTNSVQYRDRVIVTDSILLIALDNYLGPEHKFYVDGGIPQYLAKNFKQEQITVNLAEGFAKNYVYQSNRKTFLDEMIYFGKLLYFKDKIIPFKSDAEKIGYIPEEIAWARTNESPIWSYFVEKELLFSSDSKLPARFIADAPFSKFYLELDNESPGKLGQYIGWQIVKAYAERADEDLMTILQTEPEKIFKESKFKPRK
jgi:gliding motility-associated lipoprotein GldB